jgi:hypothetical protein
MRSICAAGNELLANTRHSAQSGELSDPRALPDSGLPLIQRHLGAASLLRVSFMSMPVDAACEKSHDQ